MVYPFEDGYGVILELVLEYPPPVIVTVSDDDDDDDDDGDDNDGNGVIG